MTVYTLSRFPVRGGQKRSARWKNIDVNTQPVLAMQLPNADGALGMDFIRLFDEVTVDFERMSVRVRK